MKVLLIETSRTYHGKSKGVRLSLPLGLLYMGAVLEDISGTIHVHPTLTEAFHEAALASLGHAIHISK